MHTDHGLVQTDRRNALVQQSPQSVVYFEARTEDLDTPIGERLLQVDVSESNGVPGRKFDRGEGDVLTAQLLENILRQGCQTAAGVQPDYSTHHGKNQEEHRTQE